MLRLSRSMLARMHAKLSDYMFCTGKASSKKWIESIKAVSKDGNRQSLRKWIAKECTKIGAAIVGHKLRVWRPTSCQYHSGTVQKFNAGIFEHVIAYEDGTEEALWLAVESYEDMGKPCCSFHDPRSLQPNFSRTQGTGTVLHLVLTRCTLSLPGQDTASKRLSCTMCFLLQDHKLVLRAQPQDHS